MAKLGSYYGLCPLTHPRSFLGISKGDQDGTIVVTLDPNVAVKFKLSNQKQLQSWRSKEKFSSPIIYCKTEKKYLVAFNQSHIRLWNGDEEFVDKLKKIKFAKRIYTIFECNDKSFIVFANGCVKLVSEAVELRKESNSIDDVLTDTETISEVIHASLNGEVFVGLLVSADGGQYLSWTQFGSSVYHKIVLDRINVKLNGCTFHVNQGAVNFLSLWNDGKIFSTVLDDSKKGSVQLGELFTVIDSLSCKEHVPMISLDQDYLALYGASCDEEGATLIVFNVQFKVTQCKLSFKIFTKDAKLWCVQDNLFVAVGRNLAVVPFYLDEEQLAALVGSHKITQQNDPDISIVQKLQEVSWTSDSKSNTGNQNFPEKIQEMLVQGLPESVIVEELLPELIENNDIDGISEMVELFSKISEECLVNLLHLFLSLDGSKFVHGVDCKHEDFPDGLQPLQRAALVDLVLQKSFNDVLLLPHLRKRLSTDEVLSLLRYFWFLLKEDGYDLGSLSACETETKIIEWSCVVLDANYQKLLLSKDPKIVEALTVFSEFIKEEADGFEEMVQVASLVTQMKKGRMLNDSSNMSDLKYRLEELDI